MVAVAPDAALLDALHAAARDFPWYRTLLREQGLDPADIADATAFSQRCPILTKANTFDRFPLDQLAATTPIASLAGVLTSSGHGGRFSFGLQTRAQVASGGRAIDAALDDAFGVATHTTLAVNCLPMGVGFSSDRMTVATTSVREDMAVALIKAFGPSYDQLVVVADPLFANQLLDHAGREGLDWRRHRVHVVLGEETFGERFRAYLSSCLGLDLDRPERGYVMSSFGVGELGLHLLFETPATIAVRRTLAEDPALAHDLGMSDGARLPVPMMFAYHPSRTFLEIVEPNTEGYGRLAISMLDPALPIPLLRYQTGTWRGSCRPRQWSARYAGMAGACPRTCRRPSSPLRGASANASRTGHMSLSTRTRSTPITRWPARSPGRFGWSCPTPAAPCTSNGARRGTTTGPWRASCWRQCPRRFVRPI